MQRGVRIKVCGFTDPEDLAIAVDLGIDAAGFNFAHGSRRIDPATAAPMVSSLPPFIPSVAVFVDASEETILAAMATSRCQVVQLHGRESPELAERLGRRMPVIKAFTITNPADLARIGDYPADAYLLDGPRAGSGTPWNHGTGAVSLGRPWILAGGLDPTTVRALVERLRPWGVDVASGVESSPGRKDPLRLAAFIGACRDAVPGRSQGSAT